MTPPPAGGLETEAGLAIGRDPREMTREELVGLGHGKQHEVGFADRMDAGGSDGVGTA